MLTYADKLAACKNEEEHTRVRAEQALARTEIQEDVERRFGSTRRLRYRPATPGYVYGRATKEWGRLMQCAGPSVDGPGSRKRERSSVDDEDDVDSKRRLIEVMDGMSEDEPAPEYRATPSPPAESTESTQALITPTAQSSQSGNARYESPLSDDDAADVLLGISRQFVKFKRSSEESEMGERNGESRGNVEVKGAGGVITRGVTLRYKGDLLRRVACGRMREGEGNIGESSRSNGEESGSRAGGTSAATQQDIRHYEPSIIIMGRNITLGRFQAAMERLQQRACLGGRKLKAWYASWRQKSSRKRWKLNTAGKTHEYWLPENMSDSLGTELVASLNAHHWQLIDELYHNPESLIETWAVHGVDSSSGMHLIQAYRLMSCVGLDGQLSLRDFARFVKWAKEQGLLPSATVAVALRHASWFGLHECYDLDKAERLAVRKTADDNADARKRRKQSGKKEAGRRPSKREE